MRCRKVALGCSVLRHGFASEESRTLTHPIVKIPCEGNGDIAGNRIAVTIWHSGSDLKSECKALCHFHKAK